MSGDRGLDVLADLIETAQASPQLSSAQLVERWRDRAEHARLTELAAAPLPDLDVAAVSRELVASITRLLSEAGPERRWNELIALAESTGLSDEEKRELTELQNQRRPATPPIA